MKGIDIVVESEPSGANNVTIMRLSGYVDAHTFPRFEEKLSSVADDDTRLVLDLAELTYINSTGLGFLMKTYRDLSERNGDLVVAGMSDKIQKIFDLLGFSRLIRTFDSESAALQALAGASDS